MDNVASVRIGHESKHYPKTEKEEKKCCNVFAVF